jgi:hypothetical protein
LKGFIVETFNAYSGFFVRDQFFVFGPDAR